MERNSTYVESRKLVKPQSFEECTLSRTVFNYFSEVIPETLISNYKKNIKDKIEWVKIEDNFTFDNVKNRKDTFIVIIGYANGLQAWLLNSNYEALEIISYRNGPVKIAKFLKTTEKTNGVNKRPIIACVTQSCNSGQYSKLIFLSINTNEIIHSKDAISEINGIQSSKRFVVVDYNDKIDIIDNKRLNTLFIIPRCSNSFQNTISYTDEWLAFSDNQVSINDLSLRTDLHDEINSYSLGLYDKAKYLVDGLSFVASPLLHGINHKSNNNNSSNAKSNMITIVDIENELTLRTIAHFQAFKETSVAILKFSQSGQIVAVADSTGHSLAIFRIEPHALSSKYTSVSQLYCLQRGETDAIINDISFTDDCRWICFVTHRCTVHIYAINPLGGMPSFKTHYSFSCSEANNIDCNYISTYIDFATDKTNPLLNSRYFRLKNKPITLHSIGQIKMNDSSIKQIYDGFHSSACRISSIVDNEILKSISFKPNNNESKIPHYFNQVFTLNDSGNLHLIRMNLFENIHKNDEYSCYTNKSIEPENIKVEPQYQWALNRKTDWSEIDFFNKDEINDNEPFEVTKNPNNSHNWIDSVDEHTIMPPIRRIWMGPQFKFFKIDSTNLDLDEYSVESIITRNSDIFDILASRSFPLIDDQSQF